MKTDQERKMCTSVTFDSNVWERVVDNEKRQYESSAYSAIYDLIKCGTICPYFFEGLATMETVAKMHRKEFIKNYRPGLTTKLEGDVIRNEPGSGGPIISDYLNTIVPVAIALGFKFISFPRIGAPMLTIPNEWRAPDNNYPSEDRINRSFECAIFIEEQGAGLAKLLNDLDASSQGLVPATKQNEIISVKKYSQGIGEWVDGDAIAAHYGYGLDFFCTNDSAGKSGASSIFSVENRRALKDNFDIKIVSPEELCTELRRTELNA